MPSLDFSGFFTSVLVLWVVTTLVVFGLPAAWLAGEKGRNPLAWLLAAVLIGPIAVLTVGLSPRSAGGAFGSCPRCREAVFADADVCPFCRTRYGEPRADHGWDEALKASMARGG
jgi:hypothetical protein